MCDLARDMNRAMRVVERTDFLDALGDRGIREVNRSENMTITSSQKKTILPLAVFIISTGLFVWGLGSIFVLFAVPFMALSVGMLAANVAPLLSRWFNRDGWK